MAKYELKLKRICIDNEYATIEVEADNGAAAVLKFYELTPDVEEALSNANWDESDVEDTKYQVISFDLAKPIMCQTVRYENHKGIRARASFHPEWSEANPWVTYIDGTAGSHLPTFEAVDIYFKDRGFKQLPRNDNVTVETTNQSSS